MKLTAQQLKFLVESVVNEMMDPLARDPGATALVQEMSDGLEKIVQRRVDKRSKGDTALYNRKDEVVEAAVAAFQSKIEKLLTEEMDSVITESLNALDSEDSSEEPYPADYEACDECGYDHSYEYEQAAKAHKALGSDDEE